MMRAEDIRTALSKKFTAPEYALFFEVGDATGGQARRWADALAMGLWPSRGLALQGFEIKVSRSDLLSELKNPAKAESIARYCRYWWLVTPPGLVKDGELPDGWGLYEVHPNGVRTIKPAPANEHVQDITPSFLAAILRRADERNRSIDQATIDKAINRNREAENKRIEEAVVYRTRSAEERAVGAEKSLRAIAEAAGMEPRELLDRWTTDANGFARAVALVHKLGVANSYRGVRELARTMIDGCFFDRGLSRSALPRLAAGSASQMPAAIP